MIGPKQLSEVTWTKTYDVITQNRLFFLQIVYFRNFVIAMRSLPGTCLMEYGKILVYYIYQYYSTTESYGAYHLFWVYH
jgi:hypothetical protein